MTLTEQQRRFIVLFVRDGTYDLSATCNDLGVRPSQAMQWFKDEAFRAQVRLYEWGVLAANGYSPLRVVRETFDIAHSDITEALAYAENLEDAPKRVRISVKKCKVKRGIAVVDGQAVPYIKEIELEMYGKEWALKQAAEWFNVADAPEVKAAQATKAEDGPKRIAGLIVRPPLTKEEKDLEDLLS